MAVKPGRPRFNISEQEILYAMEWTDSNKEAAKFLRIDISVYNRFAKLYTQADGKTLYDAHRGKAKRGLVSKKNPTLSERARLIQILKGERHLRKVPALKAKLLKYNILPDYCSQCGYNERRLTDYSVPLKLFFTDGDVTNNKLENLELLCHNCYYLFTNKTKRDTSSSQ